MISRTTRDTPCVWALLFALLAFLYVSSAWMALLLRGIFQFFIPGVSLWKGVLLLLFCSAVCFARCLIPAHSKTISFNLTLIFLLIAWSVGIALHFYFTHTYNLSLFDHTISFSDGFLSSNSVTHLHVTKGMTASVISAFQTWFPIKGDIGMPFLRILSPTILFISFILCVPALCALTVNAITFPANNVERSSLLWLLNVIVIFLLIKCIFDGGVFSSENISSFLIFYLLNNRPNIFYKNHSTAQYVIALLGITLGAFYSPLEWVSSIRDVVKSLCFYHIFAALLRGTVRAQSSLIMLLCLALLLMVRNYYWVNEVHAQTQLVRGEVYITRMHPQSTLGEIVYKNGALEVSKVNVPILTRIFDIQHNAQIPIGYFATGVPGKNCSPDVPYSLSSSFIVVEGSMKPELPSNKTDIFDSFTVEPCSFEDRCSYKYSVTIKGCISNDYAIAEGEFIRSLGFNTFILMTNRRDLQSTDQD